MVPRWVSGNDHQERYTTKDLSVGLHELCESVCILVRVSIAVLKARMGAREDLNGVL